MFCMICGKGNKRVVVETNPDVWYYMVLADTGWKHMWWVINFFKRPWRKCNMLIVYLVDYIIITTIVIIIVIVIIISNIISLSISSLSL